MSPLPVIDDVYRVTWNFQQNAGITPRIVQHYLAPSSNKLEVGENIVASAAEGIFGCMHEGYEPLEIEVLPLDGTSTTQTVAVGTGLELCQGTGQVVPAAAYLMHLNTDQRGPQGRGRSFVGPVTEIASGDGRVNLDVAAFMTGAWTDMLTVLAGLDPLISLGVASYVHEEFYTLQDFNFSPVLATMRRRQNQLR